MAAVVIPGISVATAQFLSVTGVILTLTGLIMFNTNQDVPPVPPPCPPFPPCPPDPCSNFFSCWWKNSRSLDSIESVNAEPETLDNNRQIASRATETQNAQTTALILIIVGSMLFIPLVLGLVLA